jgi:ATP-dependent DNA helicase DinG
MAACVSDIFEDGGILLAEAGTGTGKTLAYLVPAILSRHRVLISTGTKNLQDQIYYKDLPALQQALDVPFTSTYMKGRGNYLCLQRFADLSDSDEPRTPVERAYLNTLSQWVEQTDTGDRSEVEDLPDDVPLWSEIAATSENCIGVECARYDDCFITRMRQRAMESDLVVVNHHLLCADAAVRQSAYGGVIPTCTYMIIDEAHQLEDVATQYFGLSVSSYRLDELARDAHRIVALNQGADPLLTGNVRQAIDETRDHARTFFGLLSRLGSTGDRTRVTAETLAPAAAEVGNLLAALSDLEGILLGIPNASEETVALARRAIEIRDQVKFLLSASESDFVYFLEVRGRAVFLRASPIDVSAIVRDHLLQRNAGTILTSATLTVDGSFTYMRNRLGLDDALEVQLQSEFDFRRQTVLYLPQRMPDPRSPRFASAVAAELAPLLAATRGRAFLLFTSYANLHAVHEQLAQTVPFPLLVQGSAPRTVLLREFRSIPHAVLLATSSFWQGVDVAGDTLSCVAIDKLPFASPGDPITAARMEAIQSRGGDPFSEYQVPLAILTLLQGLGRLIRHRGDRGVLALFDPRILTKGYGKHFVASLPPAPITRDLSDVRKFFEHGVEGAVSDDPDELQ